VTASTPRFYLSARPHPLEVGTLNLYEHARVAGTWNPKTAINWTSGPVDTRCAEIAYHLASQHVYAEQLGLTNAATLLPQVDDLTARMCLAIQASDEAKHTEVFARYALQRGGAIADPLEGILHIHDFIAPLERVMERFLVHVFLEALALDEFLILRPVFAHDLLGDIYDYVIEDEGRHVAMGVSYLVTAGATSRWPSWREDLDRWAKILYEVADLNDASIDWLSGITGRSQVSIQSWFERRHRVRIASIRRQIVRAVGSA